MATFTLKPTAILGEIYGDYHNNTIVSYNGLFITIYVVHHDIGKITKA